MAAAERGRIPDDLMSDAAVVEKLPALFRTMRGMPLSSEQQDQLVEEGPPELTDGVQVPASASAAGKSPGNWSSAYGISTFTKTDRCPRQPARLRIRATARCCLTIRGFLLPDGRTVRHWPPFCLKRGNPGHTSQGGRPAIERYGKLDCPFHFSGARDWPPGNVPGTRHPPRHVAAPRLD